MTFTTSAAPFSGWHKMHGQAVVEFGYPQWVPWWEAMPWVRWTRVWALPWTLPRTLPPPASVTA